MTSRADSAAGRGHKKARTQAVDIEAPRSPTRRWPRCPSVCTVFWFAMFAGLFGWAYLSGHLTTASLQIPKVVDGLVNPLPDIHSISVAVQHPLHCRALIKGMKDMDRKYEMNGLTEAAHLTHCTALLNATEPYLPDSSIADLGCATLWGISDIDTSHSVSSSSSSLQYVWVVFGNTKPTMYQIATQENYNGLLHKQFTHPSSLTRLEQNYLNAWFDPRMLALYALSLRCNED